MYHVHKKYLYDIDILVIWEEKQSCYQVLQTGWYLCLSQGTTLSNGVYIPQDGSMPDVPQKHGKLHS